MMENSILFSLIINMFHIAR